MLRLIAIVVCAASISACAHMKGHKGGDHHTDKKMEHHHEPHTARVQSERNFDETLAALKSAIDARGFKTFAMIEHAKGAASIGETLRPTTLIIFGNPKGGTPIMQADQRLGLELPLKFLVMEDAEGGVSIVYPDYPHLSKEYAAPGVKPRFEAVAGALAAIAAEAATQP